MWLTWVQTPATHRVPQKVLKVVSQYKARADWVRSKTKQNKQKAL